MQQPGVPFPTLLIQLTDPSSQVRLQAIKSILARPAEQEQAMASLLAVLNDHDEQVLKAAISALGILNKREAVPSLTRMINSHPNARVRLRALKTLARISHAQAIPATLNALGDSSVLVRRVAVGMLGKWSQPYMVRPLLALQSDPHAAVRARVAGVLKRFADSRIVDPLLVTLDTADAATRRGNLYREAGLYEQALADFTQAIQLEPDNVEAHYNRGKLYHYNLKQHEQAITDFERVIQLQPETIQAYFERGSTCIPLKNDTQALADFNHVIEASTEHIWTFWAYLRRGIIFMKRQEYQPALADYERALECAPCRAPAYNNCGCTQHFLGNYQLAINDYNRALALEPANALYYSNRGESYLSLLQFDQAIADFEFALALKPDQPDTRGFLEKARQGKQ